MRSGNDSCHAGRLHQQSRHIPDRNVYHGGDDRAYDLIHDRVDARPGSGSITIMTLHSIIPT